jgi:hypothetical protein
MLTQTAAVGGITVGFQVFGLAADCCLPRNGVDGHLSLTISLMVSRVFGSRLSSRERGAKRWNFGEICDIPTFGLGGATLYLHRRYPVL